MQLQLKDIDHPRAKGYLSSLLEKVNVSPTTTYDFTCCPVDGYPALGEYKYKVVVAKSCINIQAFYKGLSSHGPIKPTPNSNRMIEALENYLIEKSEVADEVKLSTLMVRYKDTPKQLAQQLSKGSQYHYLIDAFPKMLCRCLQNDTDAAKADSTQACSRNSLSNCNGLSLDQALSYISSFPSPILEQVTKQVLTARDEAYSKLIEKITLDIKAKWLLSNRGQEEVLKIIFEDNYFSDDEIKQLFCPHRRQHSGNRIINLYLNKLSIEQIKTIERKVHDIIYVYDITDKETAIRYLNDVNESYPELYPPEKHGELTLVGMTLEKWALDMERGKFTLSNFEQLSPTLKLGFFPSKLAVNSGLRKAMSRQSFIQCMDKIDNKQQVQVTKGLHLINILHFLSAKNDIYVLYCFESEIFEQIDGILIQLKSETESDDKKDMAFNLLVESVNNLLYVVYTKYHKASSNFDERLFLKIIYNLPDKVEAHSSNQFLIEIAKLACKTDSKITKTFFNIRIQRVNSFVIQYVLRQIHRLNLKN